MSQIQSAIPSDMPSQRDDSAPQATGVLHDILMPLGARLGVLWILGLVLAAVFAPFLASSFPLLLKRDGHWSSPILQHLSPADVMLQIAFWIALILLPIRRWKFGFRVLLWLAIVILSAIPAGLWVKPSPVIVYQTYRLQQPTSDQWTLNALIPYSPDDHLRDQGDMSLLPPSRDHWMGTTADSADMLSNMLHASRIALSIGFISTSIAAVIGIVIGALMGYYAGLIDLLGMRLVEIFDAIPTLLLLLSFVAFFTPNLYTMMAIIGFTSWVQFAYFIRADFLSLRDRDFVQAARAAGVRVPSILFRHMLPNALSPIIVTASFSVAGAILIESTLSFLGIGLVDEASWGNLLNQALGTGGTFYWWIALYPGLAIFLTVLAYNLLGESLRDALDPKLLKD